MSFVVAVPETMTDVARSLESLAATLSAANEATAMPTTAVLPAAGDEVSASIATLFSRYGLAYQELSTQAATFHTQFMQTLTAGAQAYATAEVAGAEPLRTFEADLLALVNAPTETLLGRPLIGNGAEGTTNAQGAGTPGGAGGILWGDGGDGGASTTAGVPGGAGGPAGLIGTGGTGGMGGFGAAGGAGGTGGWLWGPGGTGGMGGAMGAGGAGGNAFLIGTGGMGGQGGTFTAMGAGGVGGTGGTGGLLWGSGGSGGTGGPNANGGAGGSAQFFGNGGEGGIGGAFANGGAGGDGGLLVGSGGAGGTGGVVSGVGGHGGTGGMLWGHSGVGGAAGGPATLTLNGVDAANGGRPTVTVSVNDGPQVQALMDSGSTAALFPESMVNPASLGTPGQQSQYAFGPPEDRTIDFYTTYTAVLNFGDGVLTKPMTIGVITAETHNGMPVTPNEAILGVGANTENLPNFATSPVQQLPGALSQGVLFNEQAAHPYVEFGPNPVAPFASVSGAPVTDDLTISVNSGPFQDLTGAFVDTGGNGGNIPSDIVNGYQPGQYLPAGTQIQVDIPNGQGGAEELYSETVGANSMQVTVSQTAPPPDGPGAFNTGNYVFKQMPIYFSYSPTGGTIEFDPAI